MAKMEKVFTGCFPQVSSSRNILLFSLNLLFENELRGVSQCVQCIQTNLLYQIWCALFFYCRASIRLTSRLCLDSTIQLSEFLLNKGFWSVKPFSGTDALYYRGQLKGAELYKQ